MRPTDFVPFGKYAGQSFDNLLYDRSYVYWLTSQPDILDKLTADNPTWKSKLLDAADFPNAGEHQKMQLRFLDPNFRMAFIEVAEGRQISPNTPIEVDFEHWPTDRGTCDVWLRHPPHEPWIIELKPCIGDDYAAIKRQVGRSKANAIVINDFSPRDISLQQLAEFFKPCDIFMWQHIEERYHKRIKK